MASELYTIHTCDRCSKKTTVGQMYNDTQNMWSWGIIWYAQHNGPVYIKKHALPEKASDFADLCPDCLAQLNRWFKFKENL